MDGKPGNDDETSSSSMDDSLSVRTWQDGDGVVLFIVSVSGDVASTKRTCGCARGGAAVRRICECARDGAAAVGPGSESVLSSGKLMNNTGVARERTFGRTSGVGG